MYGRRARQAPVTNKNRLKLTVWHLMESFQVHQIDDTLWKMLYDDVTLNLTTNANSLVRIWFNGVFKWSKICGNFHYVKLSEISGNGFEFLHNIVSTNSLPTRLIDIKVSVAVDMCDKWGVRDVTSAATSRWHAIRGGGAACLAKDQVRAAPRCVSVALHYAHPS